MKMKKTMRNQFTIFRGARDMKALPLLAVASMLPLETWPGLFICIRLRRTIQALAAFMSRRTGKKVVRSIL